MKREFIVLHKTIAKPAKESFKFGGKTRGGPASAKKATPKVQIKIERGEMEPAEALKMGRDKNVQAVAPTMPILLVKPMGKGKAAPAAITISWGVKAVKADVSPFTGKGIKVAVLDTGIDRNHPAFAGVNITEKDFTGDGDGDVNGHGTHCAGTIFGRDVNNTRIGVARGVKDVFIGKVLGENGGGSAQIIEAMQWAISKKANIISMSLGIDFPGFVKQLQDEGMPAELAASKALEGYRANVQLFDTFISFVRVTAAQQFSQPVFVIAAAGNESRLDEDEDFEIAVSPPAIAEGIVSVAALAQNGTRFSIAPFSNAGAILSGPGVDIISAKAGGGLVSFSGTSMATPHVAGVTALWMEKLIAEGANVPKKLPVSLEASCDTSGLAGQKAHLFGAGLIQAPLS